MARFAAVAVSFDKTVPAVTAVVLAAGTSSRMGAQKLLLPVRGTPMIDRVIAACVLFPTVVVASARLAGHLQNADVRVIFNTEPHLGMAHSLALADAAISPDHALAVFLGDKPLVTAALAQTIVQAGRESEADVCFPVRGGLGGHPVYFSPKARARMAALSGDTLQALRDDPRLHRVPVEIADDGAYLDVDDPGALAQIDE